MTKLACSKVGSREQVWNGTKMHTSGGLKKSDLAKNKKTGHIVSLRRRSMLAKNTRFQENTRRIKAHLVPLSKAKFYANETLRPRRTRA